MSKIYLLVCLSLWAQNSFANSSQVEQNILKTYGCDQNSFVCKAITENFNRDTNGCRLLPSSIEDLEPYIKQRNPALTDIQVFDRIRYFGPVSGKYSYDYKRLKNGKFNITAQVFFKNLNEFNTNEITTLKNKFKKAAQIWNQKNPFKKTYQFEFQIATKSSSRTVAAKLVRFDTRGPYFDKWTTRWNEYAIAHEFGHVLGLFDEYDYMKSHSDYSDCDQSSIMCNSYGDPKPYHYHLVLERSFCEI